MYNFISYLTVNRPYLHQRDPIYFVERKQVKFITIIVLSLYVIFV